MDKQNIVTNSSFTKTFLKRKTIKQIVIEIIIVTVGILIAFQLDNWRERINERDFENKILREIKAGLLYDLRDIDFNMGGHNLAISSYDSVIRILRYENYHSRTPYYIDLICREYLFTPNVGAFESLKSFNLNTLTNDSLRIWLVQLYETDYKSLIKLEEHYGLGKNSEKYYQMLLNNFDAWQARPFFSGHPKDFNSLKTNPELHLLLNTYLRQHHLLLRDYLPARNKVNKIIKEIDKELN